MKYDPEWILANLKDMQSFCGVNGLAECTHAIGHARTICRQEIRRKTGTQSSGNLVFIGAFESNRPPQTHFEENTVDQIHRVDTNGPSDQSTVHPQRRRRRAD